jgi:hypothetical protein
MAVGSNSTPASPVSGPPNLLENTLAPSAPVYYAGQTTLLISKRTFPQFDPPNLLENTLVPAVVPFTQNDWALPQGKRKTLVVTISSLQAVVQAAAPFVPVEWTIPRAAQPNIALRTHIEVRKQFYTDLSPANQQAWPLPVVRQVAPSTWTQNLLQATLAQAVTAPFVQTEWTIPRGIQPNIALRTHLEVRKQFYTDLTPANQYDWSLPVVRRTSPVSWQPNLLESTLAPNTPAYYAGQTTLLIGKRASPAFEPQNLLGSTLTLPVGVPFSQTDWKLPQRSRRTLVVEISTESSDATAPAVMPNGRQLDWPLPQQKPSLRSLTFHLEVRKQFYTEPATPPVGEAMFELPAAKPAGAITNRWFTFYYVYDETVPFYGTVDPVPQRKVQPPITSRWHAAYYVIDDSEPFKNTADPVPAPRAQRSVSLSTWTQNLLESTLAVQAAAPFNQDEWLTPQARRAAQQWLAPNLLATTLANQIAKSPASVGLTLSGVAPSVGTSVNVALGALTLAGVAPTASIGLQPIPAVGTLTFTGLAPVGSIGVVRQPASAALVFTGLTPITAGTNTQLPAAGALTFSGLTPSVASGNLAAPAAGVLAFSGLTPLAKLSISALPASGSLVFAGQAPTAAGTNTQFPAAGALALAGLAPSLGAGNLRTPAAVALTLAGAAPSVQIAANVFPANGQLTLSGGAPVVYFPVAAPASGALTFSGKRRRLRFLTRCGHWAWPRR